MSEECCVAYLDILGFKYLVDRHTELRPLSEAVLGLLSGDAATANAEKHNVDFVIFSDSLLARSRSGGRNYRKLPDMVQYCGSLLTLSIHARLPIRGAIAWGEVHWDKKIKIGAPINEAVAWEKNQDWAGVMLTGSSMAYMNRHQACYDALQELLFPLDKALLPLKADPPREIRAGVVRPVTTYDSELMDLAQVLRELGLESCNLEIQRKLEATARVFEEHPLPKSRTKDS